MLTSEEAAARLGIARVTLRRWVRLGLIEARRTPGGHFRFDPAEVERVLRPAQERDRMFREDPYDGMSDAEFEAEITS